MPATVDLRDPNAAEKADALYRESIDAAAESREHKAISNKDPRHAAYVMQTFFKHAEEHVRIYTTRLSRNVDAEPVYASRQLIKQAGTLLATKPDAHVSIILQDELDVDEEMNEADHPLIAALSRAGTRLNISKYQGERRFGDFAVMDEVAYRAEIDGAKATAIVNFGDPEFASVLAQLFDSMASSCEPSR